MMGEQPEPELYTFEALNSPSSILRTGPNIVLDLGNNLLPLDFALTRTCSRFQLQPFTNYRSVLAAFLSMEFQMNPKA